MPSQQRTASITNFRGLNERLIRGSSVTETSSLDNVTIREGVVRGRRGSVLWGGVTTPADDFIIGLWQFYHASSTAGQLVRMTSDMLEVWNGSAWVDVTGTALNGSSTARPQAVTFAELDSLIFTNEGSDRPRKYTGTGTSIELGGLPPFAKSLESYVGFLGLGNISADGITYRPYDLILSDSPDEIWEECDDTETYVTTLILDETPGEIRAMRVLGDILLVYKSDAVISVKFSLGVVRFVRRKLDFPIGILAPLSLQAVPMSSQQFFLGSDRALYYTDGQTVTPFPLNVQQSLRDMSAAAAPFVQSTIDVDKEIYSLFYQRHGVDYMDGRIDINYRTKEFTKGIYPFEISSAASFRSNFNTDSTVVVGATSTAGDLVYELDVASTGNDNGVTPTRFWDVDWTQFGSPGNKWFTGGEFCFHRATDCRVRISVASDNSSIFTGHRIYSLRGRRPNETEVRISYNTNPLFGSWFKLRIEMFHDAGNIVELVEFQPEYIPVNPTSEDLARTYHTQKA